MPVIIADASSYREIGNYADLTQILADEMRKPKSFGQPLVLVRKFRRSGLMEVRVIWDRWTDLDDSDRSTVILDSYAEVHGEEERDKVAVPVGYTEEEAVETGILPFAVTPLLRKSDPQELWDQCRVAMLELGATDEWKKGYPRLRLPTINQADLYLEELTRQVPNSEGIWSVSKDLSFGGEWSS